MKVRQTLWLWALLAALVGLPGAPLHAANALTLVGHFGGALRAGSVQGSHLYVGVGPRVEIYDVSDPSRPTFLREILLPGGVNDLAVSGDKLYAAVDGQGLWIVDVADPAAPTTVGSHSLSNGADHVFVQGSIAYVAGGADLYKLDVSNPGSVQMQASYVNPAPITALGGVVNGALVVGAVDGVRTIRLDALTQAGFVASGPAVALAVQGDGIYAGIEGEGTVVIDASDIGALSKGTSFAPTATNGLVASGSHLFVGDAIRIMVFSLATPLAPAFLANYTATPPSRLIQAEGARLYMDSQSSALVILDFTDPQNPSALSSLATPGFAHAAATNGVYTFALNGGALYILGGVSRNRPTVLGSLQDPEGAAFTEVAVQGSYAYLLREFRGLSVVDISNPAQPQEVGRLDFSGPAAGIAAGDGHVFIADGPNGLRVIDVSQPTGPKEVGSLGASGFADRVIAAGNYVYLGEGANGLHIVNVSNPALPFEAGVYQPGSTVSDMALVDSSHLLVGLSGAALEILDVSDPAKPTPTTKMDTTASIISLAVQGGKAYVIQQTFSGTTARTQLVTYDLAGGRITPEAAMDVDNFGEVFASPRRLLLSLGHAGLYIYQNPNAPQPDHAVYLPQIAR